MKKKSKLILIFLLLTNLLFAQNKRDSKTKNAHSIHYSKYIGKPLTYFLTNFKLPIRDTIAIRDYVGIVGIILVTGEKEYLYIYTKYSNGFNKNSIGGDLDSNFINNSMIRSILYKINGRVKKRYGSLTSFHKNEFDSLFLVTSSFQTTTASLSHSL